MDYFSLLLRWQDKLIWSNLEDIWIHNSESLTDDDYNNFVRYQKVQGSAEALLSILRKDFFHTLEDEIRELGELDIPTLIIWGREDASINVQRGQTMHRLMPKSRLEILEDAGHLANFDQADQFNQLVIDFLND